MKATELVTGEALALLFQVVLGKVIDARIGALFRLGVDQGWIGGEVAGIPTEEHAAVIASLTCLHEVVQRHPRRVADAGV